MVSYHNNSKFLPCKMTIVCIIVNTKFLDPMPRRPDGGWTKLDLALTRG